jgi:hypothetical protein
MGSVSCNNHVGGCVLTPDRVRIRLRYRSLARIFTEPVHHPFVSDGARGRLTGGSRSRAAQRLYHLLGRVGLLGHSQPFSVSRSGASCHATIRDVHARRSQPKVVLFGQDGAGTHTCGSRCILRAFLSTRATRFCRSAPSPVSARAVRSCPSGSRRSAWGGAV